MSGRGQAHVTVPTGASTQHDTGHTVDNAGSHHSGSHPTGTHPAQASIVVDLAGGQGEPVAAAQPEDPVRSAAAALLGIQTDLIEVRTRAELGYLAANAPRQVMRAQQIAYFETGPRRQLVVKAVSSIAHVDRSSPTTLWLESMVKALARESDLAKVWCLDATSFGGGYQSYGNGYPLRHLMWVPWVSANGTVLGGQLFARMTPWTESDARVARHLGAAFSHGATALAGSSRLRGGLGVASGLGGLIRSGKVRLLAAAAVLAAMAIPVPMSALAPVEVAPRDPVIVTSGIEGAVKDILVEPNAEVKKGDVLVKLADTDLRNRFQIAERQVTIAKTAYKKAAQLAFVDERGRHELATARSELGLRISQRNYAFELLSRTKIKAERSGVVFFSDKKDLIGRPITVGERLMELADPSRVEFRIDLGVADSIVMQEGAPVKVFLDSDPLNPISAKLVSIGYRAKVRENQELSYRLVAVADEAAAARLRLGVRGTAQVFGEQVTLGFYLFRRPIAAARQWIGL